MLLRSELSFVLMQAVYCSHQSAIYQKQLNKLKHVVVSVSGLLRYNFTVG